MTVQGFSWTRLWIAAALVAGTTLVATGTAEAAQPPVGLGSATSFAVLAGSTVTNTGPSVITGDLGVSPGSAITGFPPGQVIGAVHAADAVAGLAENDLTTAYNDAAGRTPVSAVPADLAGLVLVGGVYGGPTLGLTGTVTLDAQGDPSTVFVFQSASTLITASSSVVSLVNGADPCNVYWQIGSSATLGTNSTFVGTAMALTSITAQTSATVTGRLLARNGATTLDSNVITAPNCPVLTPATTTTTTVAAATTLPGGTTPGGGTAPGDTTPGGGTTVPGATNPDGSPSDTGVGGVVPTGITLPTTGAHTGVATLGAGVTLMAGILIVLAVGRLPRRRRNG